MWALGSRDTRRRNSVAATNLKPSCTLLLVLRIVLIISVVFFGFSFFGQEESDEESDTAEVEENSAEASTEDLTTRDSEPNEQDSATSATENTEEDPSTESDSDAEEDSNSGEITRAEEPTEDDDSDNDIFVPTENLSEDVPISFPVDI